MDEPPGRPGRPGPRDAVGRHGYENRRPGGGRLHGRPGTGPPDPAQAPRGWRHRVQAAMCVPPTPRAGSDAKAGARTAFTAGALLGGGGRGTEYPPPPPVLLHFPTGLAAAASPSCFFVSKDSVVPRRPPQVSNSPVLVMMALLN
jgi:hypothetical protein